MHDDEMKKLLKHVSTRWLSLNKCLDRLFDQWDKLVSYFKAEITQKKSVKISKSLKDYTIPKKAETDESFTKKRKCEDNLPNASTDESCTTKRKREENLASTSKKICKSKICDAKSAESQKVTSKSKDEEILTREERIFMFLSDDFQKGVASFLLFILPLFDKANLSFQTNKPIIHVARSLLLDFLKDLLSKFVLPSIVKNAKTLQSIDYHSLQNQKSDEDLVIGSSTEKIIAGLKSKKKIEFYTCIREFFIASCDYIIQKFPIEDEIFVNAQIANISTIDKESFSKVKFFIQKYSVGIKIIGALDEDKACDVLKSEFCSLQQEEISSDILNVERADVQWHLIGQLKNSDGSFKYKNISDIMLLVLTIPHSNAECERIFSFITKISTQFRASMSRETLENLLICKSNPQGHCYEQQFDSEFLKRAKSATVNALQKQL